jgi:hypothetical protein
MLELYTSPMRRRWHLEIQACFDRRVRGVGAEPARRQHMFMELLEREIENLPVRHDEAVEFPFSSKEVFD